ncbi:MAG: DUF2079 domain-containing protein [candidate division WWE3 bacterium]|nr:DUF2079 domain-containing protein [candidate division WWE3 bacterium]
MTRVISIKNLVRKFLALLPFGILLTFGVVIFKVSTRLLFYKYATFQTSKFDLGIMAQTVWNTAHGRFFEFTDHFGTNMSQAATHTDYLMVIFAPLFWIWNDPRVLLVAQALLLTSSVIPIYLLIKIKTKSNWLGLIWGIIFLVYPAVAFLLLSDFHSVTLVIPLFIWAFYFLEKNWLIPFLIVIGLALFGKEEISLIVIFFGLYIAFFRHRKHLGLAVITCGILWAIVTFGLIIPSYGGIREKSFTSFTNYALSDQSEMFRTGNSQNFFLNRYDQFGDSYTNIAWNIISNPKNTLSVLISSENRDYLFKVFGPLIFIPALNLPIILITLPEFAINLLSNNSAMKGIKLQYISSIIPFLFVSSIFFIAYLKKRVPGKFSLVSVYSISLVVLVASLWASSRFNSPLWPYLEHGGPLIKLVSFVNNYFDHNNGLANTSAIESTDESNLNISQTSGLPGGAGTSDNANLVVVKIKTSIGNSYEGLGFSNPKDSDTAEYTIKQIPEKASVSAPNFLGAQLSLRPSLALFPANYKDADDVVVDLASDQVLHSVDNFNITPLIPKFVSDLLSNNSYQIKYFGNSLILFEKSSSNNNFKKGLDFNIEVLDTGSYLKGSEISYNSGLSLQDPLFPDQLLINSDNKITQVWAINRYFSNKPLIITTSLVNKESRKVFQLVNLASYSLNKTDTWDAEHVYKETLNFKIPSFVAPGNYDLVVGISDFDNKNIIEARYIKEVVVVTP